MTERTNRAPDDIRNFNWITIPARHLSGEHIGWEMHLNGKYVQESGEWGWVETWAPLTRIVHVVGGDVEVRRYPDEQGQHLLRGQTIYMLRKRKES